MQDFDKVKEAGRIAAKARNHGITLIQEGRSLFDVAVEVESFIIKEGAHPSFPVNIDINHEAAHFTPIDNTRKFLKGDVVKLDVGAHIDGYITDTATTVEVGSNKWDRLIVAGRNAVDVAIKNISTDIETEEIGKLIFDEVQKAGKFGVITNLFGHGIDRWELHTDFAIPNYEAHVGGVFQEGHTYAIEPFVTNGRGHVRDGKSGNIWYFIQPKPLRNPLAKKLLEAIESDETKYTKIPFTQRWLTDVVPAKKIDYVMSLLENAKCISPYNILLERQKSVVSQAEHTIFIKNGKPVVMTK